MNIDNYTDLARCMDCEPHEVSRLIQQHAPWNGRDLCNDSTALVTEIGRLRDNSTRIMLEAERHRRIANEAIERIESAETERQAIVSWLREQALDPEATGTEFRLLQDHATRIERGEHQNES